MVNVTVSASCIGDFLASSVAAREVGRAAMRRRVAMNFALTGYRGCRHVDIAA